MLALNGLGADHLAEMKSAAIGRRNAAGPREFERVDDPSGLGLAVFDDLPTACSWLGVD